MSTRPSDELIGAWIARLKLKDESKLAAAKANELFREWTWDGSQNTKMRRQADQLHILALKMEELAEREFRQALTKVYGKRWRMRCGVMTDAAMVFVHEPYSTEETALKFTKSLKLKVKKPRARIRTAAEAIERATR